MIDGVTIRPLRKIPDERGSVLHMLRNDDAGFSGFGEIYFSSVHPGAVKGWHLHKRMELRYAVPVGMIKLVLYDDRPKSPTVGQVQEIFTGDDNYALITVPPLVWNGFKGIGTRTALVANCGSIPHHPDEIERRPPHDGTIPYKWDRVDR